MFGFKYKLWGIVLFCIFLAAYFGYRYVVNLQEANADLQVTVVAQEINIATKDGQLQARADELEDYQERLIESAAERGKLDQSLKQARENSEYIKGVFANHDFAKLLDKKPGLIATRMRNATKRVFAEVEQASRGYSRDKAGQADNLPEGS